MEEDKEKITSNIEINQEVATSLDNQDIVIKLQDRYSRGQLLLRSFWGWFYIYLPHWFMLYFIFLFQGILSFISGIGLLFTSNISESYYRFIIGLNQWWGRLEASRCDIVDGYPDFGLNTLDDKCIIYVPYQQRVDRLSCLLRMVFGTLYVLLPHAFALLFMIIYRGFLGFFSWWSVLFAGSHLESYKYVASGTIRWQLRINMYMSFITHEYPPFSLR